MSLWFYGRGSARRSVYPLAVHLPALVFFVLAFTLVFASFVRRLF